MASSGRVAPPPPPRTVTLQHYQLQNQQRPGGSVVNKAVVCSLAVGRRTVSGDSANQRLLTTAEKHTVTYRATRYAYSVNGVVGSAAQASAAAAFFARATQKLNLGSPHRRRHHSSGGEDAETCSGATYPFATDFCALLRRSPPPPPANLLRRLGTRENPGVGKVRVMLKVAPPGGPEVVAGSGSGTASGTSESNCFLTVDKKRKQITLQEPPTVPGLETVAPEDRRIGVTAPKIFAFDGLFTSEDPQVDIAASVLGDIVTAVINGSDGCVFSFGHPKLGKTFTMVGNCDSPSNLGMIPTAIAWLFKGISEQKTKTGSRFSVRVSAVEVSGPNETLRDLLAPHATEAEQSPGVYLRDDPLLGTQLQNQSELRAPTLEKAAFYLDAALSARSDSDRRFSHLLYTLHVYQYTVDKTGRGGVAGGRSRLHLLDLGSCDRGRAGGSSSNTLTLSALGNVLVALFNGQRHLPHKEHKITQVLRECLGSLTCQAALIAHVSATASYSDTLSTAQMASRIHRMRRRRIKQMTGGPSTGGSGSGGSSEESRLGLTSSRSSGEDSSASADPSSSEQSCDTVIYVGPLDDATDGEHPPVYLPSLNSGDNRCAMSKALRGSTAEQSEGSARPQKMSSPPRTVPQVKKEDPKSPKIAKGSPASKSPQVNRKPKVSGTAEATPATPGSKGAASSDEQWIDGPRIHKSRMTEVRNLVRNQREMWVDGPPGASATPAVTGYGYMDEHKKGMIRQWVESQSAQVVRAPRPAEVWVDTQPPEAHPVKVLTMFKTCDDDEPAPVNTKTPPPKPCVAPKPVEKVSETRRKSLRMEPAEQEVANEEVAVSAPEVPPVSIATGPTVCEEPQPTLEELCSQCEMLAESLSQQSEELSEESEQSPMEPHEFVQQQIKCEPWTRTTFSNETIQEEESEEDNSTQRSQSVTDYSPEYIEVEEPDEPVPMQDCCLQVTEEDIALSMLAAEGGQIFETLATGEEHPLRVLSQENLTVVSHFTGETQSQGTASEWESIQPGLLEASASQSAFFKTQLEHIARLQQMYQPTGNILQAPTLSSIASHIGSFKDLPLLSQNWATPSSSTVVASKSKHQEAAQSSPARRTSALGSTIGMELERELGLSKLTEPEVKTQRTLSSLRHPDGASNPHLDKHGSSVRAYESEKRLLDPSESELARTASVTHYTEPMVPVTKEETIMDRTIPGKSDGESEEQQPPKSAKLSRLFGTSKKHGKSPNVTKRTSISTMTSSPSKSSPKPEKKTSSKSREAKYSPSKSVSKSPARAETLLGSPKSRTPFSKPSKTEKDKTKAARSSKKEAKQNGKREAKSYGFSYESCHQVVPSSLCPSEGYESGGSDSGVHIAKPSPILMKTRGSRAVGHLGRHISTPGSKSFSSGTSTSGSGGSGGSGGHYESSGYESVMRDSECSSIGSSQDSDRDTPADCSKAAVVNGQSSSCTIL